MSGFPHIYGSRPSIRRKPVSGSALHPVSSSPTSFTSNSRTYSLDSDYASLRQSCDEDGDFEFFSESQNTTLEERICDWCDESRGKCFLGRWYCGSCPDLFCDDCWAFVPSHRKNAAGHERIARQKREFYENLFDGQTSSNNANHVKDMATLWFAVDYADTSEKTLEFEEYPRFSQLVSEHRAEYKSEGDLYPRLVSFVGSTGAGKSTLIRLLLERRWRFSDEDNSQFQSFSKPINGNRHRSVPTSGDVHLYRDPFPDYEDLAQPLFFADCEGIDGGAMRPIATKIRQKCSNPDFAVRSDLGGVGYQLIRRSVSHMIKHDPSGKAIDKRQYSVEKLYPRLLYNFSEVVIHLIPGQTKTLEKNIHHILQWAHASEGSATNRVSMPHLIVVINQAPENSMWDHREATAKLLEEQSQSLIDGYGARFRKLQSNPEQINSMEDLLRCYYSGVDFIFLPNSQGGKNLHLFETQLKTLYRLINDASLALQQRKEESRVLLSSKGQEMLIKLAFEHYTEDVDQPFDFIQRYFSLYPIAYSLSGNFLRLLQEIQNTTQDKWVPGTYLDQVVPVLVSSAALDAMRVYPDFPGTLLDIMRGTKDVLSDKTDFWKAKPPQESYFSHIKSAVQQFCDRFVTCDYVDEFGERCINKKLSHTRHKGQKGHNLRISVSKDGAVAVGDFQSNFTAELLANLDFAIEACIHAIDNDLTTSSGLVSPTSPNSMHSIEAAHRRFSAVPIGLSKLQRMWQLHMRYRAALSRLTPSLIWRELSICSYCFKGESVEVLPCDHGICVKCIQALGSECGDPRAFRISQCELHSQPIPFIPPYTAHLKPSLCSSRVLTIDGGGVRGVVGLRFLAALEERMGGEIPIQRFFDLIAGTSAGAFAAIGLGIKDMSVRDLIQHFQICCEEGFSTTRMPVVLQGLRPRFKLSSSTPHSMDEAIKKVLGESAEREMIQSRNLTSLPLTPRPKVFVTATLNSTRGGVIVPNYIRPNKNSSHDSPYNYKFHAPNEREKQLRLWQAARASSSAPTYFPPFFHSGIGDYLYDGGLFANNPAAVALEESFKIWPNQGQVDTLLSVGNGNCVEPPKLNTLTPICETVNTLAALKNILLKSIDSEKIWIDRFVNQQSGSPFSSSRYFRMNMTIDEQIRLDDTKSFGKSLALAEKFLKTPQARELMDIIIHRLIATSFYLEPSRIETQHNGMFQFTGKLKCRFLNGSLELRSLYNLLGRTFHRNPFWFQLSETHQVWTLTPENLRQMRDQGVFEVDVKFPLGDRKELDLVLVSYEFDPQSISGCPLKLREKAQADLVPEFAKFRC